MRLHCAEQGQAESSTILALSYEWCYMYVVSSCYLCYHPFRHLQGPAGDAARTVIHQAHAGTHHTYQPRPEIPEILPY